MAVAKAAPEQTSLGKQLSELQGGCSARRVAADLSSQQCSVTVVESRWAPSRTVAPVEDSVPRNIRDAKCGTWAGSAEWELSSGTEWLGHPALLRGLPALPFPA